MNNEYSGPGFGYLPKRPHVESQRPKVQLTMTLPDVVALLSEGNPGALSVTMQLASTPDGLFYLLALDDMNMRGPQIWVAYKDACGSDIGALRTALKARDPYVVEIVNRECPGTERAVTSGGSYAHKG